MKPSHRIAFFLVAALFTGACGKSEPGAETPAPASQPAPAAAATLDVCALLSKEDAGTALGATVSAAEPGEAQGSLLGACKYVSDGGIVMLSARPAREFDASVRAYEGLAPVEGLGAKAFASNKLGMLLQPEGKSYFVHIMLVGGSGPKQERLVALAKKIVSRG